MTSVSVVLGLLLASTSVFAKTYPKVCKLYPDTTLGMILATQPVLTEMIADQNYIVLPEDRRVNFTVHSVLTHAGCDRQTEKCSYTCQVNVELNDAPYTEVMIFGRSSFTRPADYANLTKSDSETLDVKAQDQLNFMRTINPFFPATERLNACVHAIADALAELKDCNPKAFYKNSRR